MDPIELIKQTRGRRSLLQAMGVAAIGISFGGLAACSKGEGKKLANGEEAKLNFYNWDTYIGDTTLDDFEEATGVDTRRFIARHAYGTSDVPLAALLESQGVKLQWKASANIPSLDVRTRKQGESLMLATVLEGGAGHKGGLSAGDVLVAIDGLRVDAPAGLELLLAQYRAGERVNVHVFRRDELRQFRVRLSGPEALECVLV